MIAETTTPAFSTRINARGELLMHHQCWFFGRDILHPDGNLLIEYGFERLGVTNPKVGTNRYRLTVTNQFEVDLWGFGMFYGRAKVGGIFIKRYDFRPRFFDRDRLGSRIFKSDHLPSNGFPRNEAEIRISKDLAINAIGWILGYEDWIEQRCGKNWRRRCLREWSNSCFPARNIRKNWVSLVKQIERWKGH